MSDELVHRFEQSPNFNVRAAPISMVVLHYTDMKTADEALERMCDEEAQVSAHYLISRTGEVIQMVSEEKRAWHAGASFWRGTKDVNSASIGIELDNDGHQFGYKPFPKEQMEALIPLLARIVEEHDIARSNVVGHSDVAPARKVDPGELFDWEWLAKLGLAIRRPDIPLGDPFENDGAFYLALERYGYDITDGHKAVEAFQRRWRPSLIDGMIDGQLRAMLFHLLLERDRGNAR